MQTIAALLFVLANLISVNPDFSQGLAGWSADVGWKARNGGAQIRIEATDGPPSFLCSQPYPLPSGSGVTGMGRVIKRTPTEHGYLFLGQRWYDANGKRMYDEAAWTDEGRAGDVWLNASWTSSVPSGAASVSWCAQGVAYPGFYIKNVVDDAFLAVSGGEAVLR